MALQSEPGRTEQIISQFLSKVLHAVLAARIPHLAGAGAAPEHRRLRRRDKWFNLALGDPPGPVEHHGGVMDPMVVDIILTPSVDDAGRRPETVVERWTAQCEPPPPPWTASAPDLYKKTYKKSIILLRSLFAVLRLLPAYRVFRMLSSSNQSYNYDLSFRVSSFAEPFSREEESELRLHSFTPVETQFGQLVVSVHYRPGFADFNFEVSSLLPSMIITDYVGSPAADPMRAFPSSPHERGAGPTPFPMRGARSPASPSAAGPHSWAGAPMQHHALSSSPIPVAGCRISPPDGYGHRLETQRPMARRKGGFSFDEFRLSPPFSPSPSPSPPAHGSNYLQSRLRSETAPVSIPQTARGKIQVHCGPSLSAPSRSSLPPPSPRSTRADLSSQESPSESRSFRKSEGLKIGDVYSHLQWYTAQKGPKDGRDDSGRFSGVLSSGGSPLFGFSRSSSRLSIQDDLDDEDFSCPFAVDDVDTSDSQARSLDGREASESGQGYASSHKSQAAVGVLIQMLRTAPPLRQDHSCSSSPSSKHELSGEEVGTSSFFLSRRTSDALAELQSYKEMKDILLTQSKSHSLDSAKERTK